MAEWFVSKDIKSGDHVSVDLVSRIKAPSRDGNFDRSIMITMIEESFHSNCSGHPIQFDNYRLLSGNHDLAPFLIHVYGPHTTCGLAFFGERPSPRLAAELLRLTRHPVPDEASRPSLIQRAWNDDWGWQAFCQVARKLLNEIDPEFNHWWGDDRPDRDLAWEVWHLGVELYQKGDGVRFEGMRVVFLFEEWAEKARSAPNLLAEKGSGGGAASMMELAEMYRCREE